MSFVLDLHLMMLLDSSCYGFFVMLALICPWFHKKWCEIEYVMLIWTWALNLRVARVFEMSKGWRWCGGTSWLVRLNFWLIWIFVLFDILFDFIFWSKHFQKSQKIYHRSILFSSIWHIFFGFFLNDLIGLKNS